MQLTTEQLAKINDPSHPIFLVMERMQQIEDKMRQNDPAIGTHLKEIWKTLQEYEELAHLLTPEQIGVLTRGLQKHTAVQLVVEGANKKSSGKSKKVSVDDLI